MAKLTHEDLVNFGQLLGYSLDFQGLCAGFSGMLLQAILAQEEDQFWQRLKLIESYKTDFTSLIRAIEEVKLKVKTKTKKLNEQDIEFLELLAFYEGIELYLNPKNHQPVFNEGFVTQTNLNEIYSLTHSWKLENTQLRTLLDKAYAFSHSCLMNYLNDLETILVNYPELPILISNSEHCVLLKHSKRHAENPWMYVDINDFGACSELAYYRELATKELADSLFYSLSEESEHIVFNARLIVNTNPLFVESDSLEQLNRQYEINPEQAKIYNESGAGLLYFSCKHGDVATIKLLLACKDIELNRAKHNGVTPLFIACQYGHIEAIECLLAHQDIEVNKERDNGTTPLAIACYNGQIRTIECLLAHQDIDINKAANDGITPFHIACYKGNIDVVTLFLQSNNIDVNCVGRQHTPLLVSCLSPSTIGNNELFRVLLEHKANVFYKDDTGATALDIAFEVKNGAAIEEILTYAKKNNLPLSFLMSPETQEKAQKWASVDVSKSGLKFFIPNPLSDLKQFVLQNLSETLDLSMGAISMMVLGGFITAVGIATVAIAFTVLHAASGLAVIGIGVATALSGMGLFAVDIYKDKDTLSELSLDAAECLVPIIYV